MTSSSLLPLAGNAVCDALRVRVPGAITHSILRRVQHAFDHHLPAAEKKYQFLL